MQENITHEYRSAIKEAENFTKPVKRASADFMGTFVEAGNFVNHPEVIDFGITGFSPKVDGDDHNPVISDSQPSDDKAISRGKNIKPNRSPGLSDISTVSGSDLDQSRLTVNSVDDASNINTDGNNTVEKSISRFFPDIFKKSVDNIQTEKQNTGISTFKIDVLKNDNENPHPAAADTVYLFKKPDIPAIHYENHNFGLTKVKPDTPFRSNLNINRKKSAEVSEYTENFFAEDSERAPAPLLNIFPGGAGYFERPVEIAGKRAEGGPVEPGKDYLVGEKGPEILRMGDTAGSVVPGEGSGEKNEFKLNIENINIAVSNNQNSHSIVSEVKRALDELARAEFPAEAGIELWSRGK